jgi:hypothetical protein
MKTNFSVVDVCFGLEVRGRDHFQSLEELQERRYPEDDGLVIRFPIFFILRRAYLKDRSALQRLNLKSCHVQGWTG